MFLSIYLLFSLLCEFVCVKKSPVLSLVRRRRRHLVLNSTRSSFQREERRKRAHRVWEAGGEETRKMGMHRNKEEKGKKKIIFCEK